MTRPFTTIILAAALFASTPQLFAQAGDIPSAAPISPSGQTPEERGRALIELMITSLGGDGWLNRTTIYQEGHNAAFFHGQPNPGVVDFREYHRLASPPGQPDQTEADRVEFTKKRDVVQVWTPTAGFEITYKGNNPLPEEQVTDTLRRRAHSIESVVHTWIKAKDTVILYEGTSMVERHMTDKVSILAANNDAITIELDATSHLPLRRTFQWRNEKFKDYDEDSEEYDDYHPVQGLPTPLTITRYRNGDMITQRYITKTEYNVAFAPAMFDPTQLLKPKK
jgi:hypothetical protein